MDFDLNPNADSDSSTRTNTDLQKSHKFYAVARGRQTGIFYNWKLCELSVNGFKGSKFSSFKNLKMAFKFLTDNNIDSSSISIISTLSDSQNLSDYCIANNIEVPVPDSQTQKSNSADTISETFKEIHVSETLSMASSNNDSTKTLEKSTNMNVNFIEDPELPDTLILYSPTHSQKTSGSELLLEVPALNSKLLNATTESTNLADTWNTLNFSEDTSKITKDEKHDDSNIALCSKCQNCLTDDKLECYNCKKQMHYTCAQLLLYQVYIYSHTSRRFTCYDCTMQEIPQEFMDNWSNLIPNELNTYLSHDQFMTKNMTRKVDTSSATTQTLETNMIKKDVETETTVIEKTEAETETVEPETSSVTCDMKLCHKLTEALSSIKTHLHLEDKIYQLEDKFVNRLIDSERLNNQLRIDLIQKDLEQAKDVIVKLKQELKTKDAELKTSQNLPNKLSQLEIGIEKLKNEHQHESNQLILKCEILSSKNTDLNTTIQKLLVNECSLKEEIHDLRNKNNELLSKVHICNEESARLNNIISDQRDELLATKLSEKENAEDKFEKPKNPIKNTWPRTDTKTDQFQLENKFSLLSSLETENTICPNDHKAENMSNASNSSNKSNPESDKPDVLIIGNSHTSRINPKKIYKNKTCLVHELTSKGILGAEQYIDSCPVVNPKTIVFQVASNDLEHYSADLCILETKTLIDKTFSRYPDVKVCVSEALPRELNTLSKTKEYMEKMKNYNRNLQNIEKIHIIKNRNIDMQLSSLWSDKIHLSSKGLALLIRNYKEVLNPLLGMKSYDEYRYDQPTGNLNINPYSQTYNSRNRYSSKFKSASYPVPNFPPPLHYPPKTSQNMNYTAVPGTVSAPRSTDGFLYELESLIKNYRQY